MSSVVGALTGGNQGLGYKPEGANITSYVSKEQADKAYQDAQLGLQQQQEFLKAVQAQNGLQNQTDVYNQYKNVAAGTGPNPAQAMLNNTTGQNVANQAALMASQRGSSSNPGLIARQAAMQGGNLQQQAAGQAAALQAQQSLNALNQMGGLATNQANQQANALNSYQNAALQQQNNLLNAGNQQNQANVAMQSNLNNVAGGVANNAAAAQTNTAGGLMGGIGSAMQMFGGKSGGAGGAGGIMGMFGGASDAAGGMGAAESLGDGSGIGSAIGQGAAAYASGGAVTPLEQTTINPVMPAEPSSQAAAGPKSFIGQDYMNEEANAGLMTTKATPIGGAGAQNNGANAQNAVGNVWNTMHNLASDDDASAPKEAGKTGNLQWSWDGANKGVLRGNAIGSYFPVVGNVIGSVVGGALGGISYEAQGGLIGNKKVPAMVSPGEKYLDPQDVEQVKQGKNPLQAGETIPGRPKVQGAKDSYANDIIPMTLEEGGIVLPRSVTQHKDAPKKAAEFVAAVLKQQAMKKGK